MTQQEANFNQQYKEGRAKAVKFAGSVYTGGVVAATVIFLFFVLTAFPETAYLIRFLMVVAGLLVGASALAFPVALHEWAVSGTHRNITAGFYYGEILLIFLNTIVSFSALLYKFAGNAIPPWIQWYEPFTIATLGYVILAWGTIFFTDPQAKFKADEHDANQQFQKAAIDGMRAYLGSRQGREAIQMASNKKIAESFSTGSGVPVDWLGADAPAALPPGVTLPGYPALPTPASSTPIMLPSRQGYTLDRLLGEMNLSREDAIQLIKTYGLWDATTALNAFHGSGYLPPSFPSGPMGLQTFMRLYCELLGVPPTWGPVTLSASSSAPGGPSAPRFP
jgi:hypothetical protein